MLGARCRRRVLSWLLAPALLTLGCRPTLTEQPAEMQPGPAERGPAVPRSPDPPIRADGCPPHATSDDPERSMTMTVEGGRYGSTQQRPLVSVGAALRVTLVTHVAVDQPIIARFCLQRPDHSVVRAELSFKNAEVLCRGCDLYPGAPPDACNNACEARYTHPQLEAFAGVDLDQAGAYRLSVEAEHGDFAPASLIIEVAPP